MATRSTIAKENADGTIASVYCHFDGYPKGVGQTLADHYTDPAKIDQLLALGDLSILDAEIGDRNDFDNPIDGICLFYKRDRGRPVPTRFSIWTLTDGWQYGRIAGVSMDISGRMERGRPSTLTARRTSNGEYSCRV